MKHSILFTIILLACSFTHAAQQPNILVFLIDDMGVMDTSLPFLTDSKCKP